MIGWNRQERKKRLHTGVGDSCKVMKANMRLFEVNEVEQDTSQNKHHKYTIPTYLKDFRQITDTRNKDYIWHQSCDLDRCFTEEENILLALSLLHTSYTYTYLYTLQA